MTTIPKRLRIIGKVYKVKVVDRVDEEDSDGESDPVNEIILMAGDRGFGSQRDTMLHETIHAIEHQMHLELTEKQVELLATGMLAVLRDNRTFVRWLLAKEPE